MSLPGETPSGVENYLALVEPGTGTDLAERYLAMPGDNIITLHEGEFTGQKTLIKDVLGPKYAYVHAWHGVQSARAYAEGITFALWVLEQSGETTVISPESVAAFGESLRQEEEALGAKWMSTVADRIAVHNHEYVLAAFIYARDRWGEEANYAAIAALEVYEALNAQAQAEAMKTAFGPLELSEDN